MQRKVEIPPVHPRPLLFEGREHVRHQVAQEFYAEVLVDGGDALLQDLEPFTQFLELGLVRLLVFVAPVGRLVVPHLQHNGIQDRGQHFRVGGGQRSDLPKEGQEVGQRGNDG